MADFRYPADTDQAVSGSKLTSTEQQRLASNQYDAETQRLLRQNAQAATNVAKSFAESQISENQSAAETQRLLRQNSALGGYTNTLGTAGPVNVQREVASPKPTPVRSRGSIGTQGNKRPNPLDIFANYTYGITMYVGSAAEYVPGSISGQKMIASGGHREGRLPQFYEDFYFENLKFESVVGVNARSRNSNVITFEFTVVEPFGISLMDRLLETAKNIGVDNWHEMIFSLQVDFFGNDDNGEPLRLEDQSKFFQVKLIGCDIKASARGSEYKFTAIPFGHQAYTQTIGTTPINFEVIGEKVEDIFSDNKDGSYTKALNKRQKDLVDKKHQDQADIYKFEIDSSISGATIVTSKLNNVRSATMPNDEGKVKKSDALQAKKSGSAVELEMNKQRIAVNAGTPILDFINLIIRNSSYISEQINPEPGNSGDAGSKPLNWFKIIPEVKYGSYDKKRNTYQKTITYHVLPYTLYNTKYPDAPIGLPSNFVKEYNYIYTGLNDQIIDFSIDFNTMFYTMMTTSREKLSKNEVKPENGEEKDEEDKGSGAATGARSIAPNQLQPVPGMVDVATPNQGTNDVKNIGANDLYKSLMTSSRGDMINVKLKISGDPEFIKQDDVYYGPNQGSGNSIATDVEEIYVKLFFRAPTDIDQESGQMDFSSYPTTVFSGIYRVLRVESLFERGAFTQVLDLIRLFGQEDSAASGGTSRSASPQRQVDAPSGAKEQAEQQAVNNAQQLLASGRLNSYTDPRSTLYYGRQDGFSDPRSLLREQLPRVPGVTDPDEIARENVRLQNRAINNSRVRTDTATPSNVDQYFPVAPSP